MIFKKDSFLMGAILGFIGPLFGILLFKMLKFQIFSFKETFQFMYTEPGHHTFTVALSLALLVNAVLFTIFINTRRDKTAKGIFVLTCVYGLLVLCIKTFT
jgi:cell division protein FtsX